MVKENNIIEMTNLSEKKLRRLQKREKRREKLKNRLINSEDISYQGPLSYRTLRIGAWISIIFGQIVFLNAIGTSMMDWNPLGNVASNIFSFLSSLATPLFIVASFGLVLNRKRNYSLYLALYGAAFLAIGLGISFFYFRYVNGILELLSAKEGLVDALITQMLESHVQINVFADLFAFASFNFFINYKPKKFFDGKKLILFRLFSILPVAFVLASYVLKVLSGLQVISLSFYFYPFLTTKNPVIFAIFAIASLWIKNRERLFERLGATQEEYQKYLLTKRNSLSFSINLSIIIAVLSAVEALVILVLVVIYGIIYQGDAAAAVSVVYNAYGMGQAIPMLIIIPILFLYSYTRDHKKTLIDIFVPIVGIGICALVYVEGFYQFILQLTQ